MAALGYVQALRKSTKHGRRTRALPNSVGNTQEMDRKKTTTTTHKLDRFDRILPGKPKSWDILHVDPNPQPPAVCSEACDNNKQAGGGDVAGARAVRSSSARLSSCGANGRESSQAPVSQHSVPPPHPPPFPRTPPCVCVLDLSKEVTAAATAARGPLSSSSLDSGSYLSRLDSGAGYLLFPQGL